LCPAFGTKCGACGKANHWRKDSHTTMPGKKGKSNVILCMHNITILEDFACKLRPVYLKCHPTDFWNPAMYKFQKESSTHISKPVCSCNSQTL